MRSTVSTRPSTAVDRARTTRAALRGRATTCARSSTQHRIRLKVARARARRRRVDIARPSCGRRQLVRARGLRPVRRSASTATRTCAASSCTRSSSGIRCARTTRRRSASRWCGATIADRPMSARADAMAPPSSNAQAASSSAARTSRTLGRRAELPTEPMTAQHGPVAPRDARHRAHRARPSTARRSSSATSSSATCTAASRRKSEHATWTQVFPYTDRLNYVSPMLNNVGYALAVEKLLGIDRTIPERAQYIRVIVGEMSRITDHLTCLGATAMELGAFTPFLYVLKAREWLCELLEEVSRRAAHAQLRAHRRRRRRPARRLRRASCATSWRRSRSVIVDVEQAAAAEPHLPRPHGRHRHRSPQADAIAYGWTGPCLRSTGVAYDVRKDHPYLVYDRFDFDVPVGTTGDNFDRYLVRIEEMRAVDAHPRPGARRRSRRARCCSTTRASCCRPRARSTTRSRR